MAARVAIRAPVAANTFLPTGRGRAPLAFRAWRFASQLLPRLPIGGVARLGCTSALPTDVVAADEAPFPDERHKAAARVFPTRPDDPASEASLAAHHDRGRGGNVTFLQHFGSALNRHVHFHTLALDGVYVAGAPPDAPPEFVRAPAPTPEQVR